MFSTRVRQLVRRAPNPPSRNLRTFLLRHFCFDIGGRVGPRSTGLFTSLSSIHNPKKMLRMLVKVLCRDSIGTSRGLSGERNVTFEDFWGAASDFVGRYVAIEGLISVLY